MPKNSLKPTVHLVAFGFFEQVTDLGDDPVRIEFVDANVVVADMQILQNSGPVSTIMENVGVGSIKPCMNAGPKLRPKFSTKFLAVELRRERCQTLACSKVSDLRSEVPMCLAPGESTRDGGTPHVHAGKLSLAIRAIHIPAT
ncbi:hypothetical protein IVB16_17480 [Bradyrhizobium sp. 183]|uniref:hypothetical protein n=1 Tax=unclassified Bradyrhizobium TaxID=2631580 RepID=UPI001FFE9E62|nr:MULTISPECIES: hypothetical protein [unclassified Bradyrhizobium]UPJ83604.1 hypothetical protein IVB17_17480 [Bradyrhizobium sp. 184]UPJ91395.1 hypothetical protein IVB16_17480 [Bradyrhizobium sp. 183]